jgi:hypothetical protein
MNLTQARAILTIQRCNRNLEEWAFHLDVYGHTPGGA